ncbi:SDR family NAD(P)-dependent oxidoreductase [Paenibacillus piri]|uniref:SDR family oxidoreductase n=1 Tax=Paenibacillus piri TaxID=2547395 RepID=A0A4R5KMY7_9BACL|nr:SDR family NAD(P)-dependent oxidoreductase [Paenibacillus piri]TDF95930.1 SDR family oxidoreductase [Paenibacillus piri]
MMFVTGGTERDVEEMNKRTVLITGGNRGIGLAIGTKFAQEGYAVVILDLPDEPSPEALQLVTSSGGAYFRCDISKKSVVDQVVGPILEQFGFVDVLVNNAGILRWKSVLDTTEEDLDTTFDVNVKGMYFVTQPIAHEMIKRKEGNIINMASMGGKWGGTLESAYCASKAAVIELTRVMAMEFGPSNIRVNSLCPGIIQTRIGEDAPKPSEYWLEKTPLGRLGKPEDVAEVAYFLASPAARYMTGQPINVTGGMIMY